MKTYISIFFLFLTLTALSADPLPKQRWDGWKVNINGGAFGVFQHVLPEDTLRIAPCAELGVEYGICFGQYQQFYVGGDILFNIFFPDSFKLAGITLFGKNHMVYPIFFPVFDMLVGYNLNIDSQILVGSTYLWGLTWGIVSLLETICIYHLRRYGGPIVCYGKLDYMMHTQQ
ncbi:MAG: hypothetical protein H6492_01940 [Candidatus Paracaedibacteraceae bacterium]|nr:hypothetical protein [Candidatus Paracaedibacteraceae bacterium]